METTEVKKNKTVVLHDLLIFRSLYEENEEQIVGIINKFIDLKILEIRALVLDLVESDYTEDIENIYKPEDWMVEVTKNLRETLFLDDIKETMIFTHFNEKFIKECKDIFLSKNKKFGKSGN